VIRPRATWAVTAVGAVLAALTLSAAEAAAQSRGHLFIVGGGERPPELMQRFVDLAGGADSARIVVIPMASSSPGETGRAHAGQLRELGADARPLVLDRERADAADAIRAVRRATGVWFPGGSQSRLADTLRSTGVLSAIRRRYREGAAVGGTSAGAAVMSDSMITGDQILPDADTAGYYGDEFPRVARDYIVLEPGFGLLSDVVVDQHFLRRERHNRLISVILVGGGGTERGAGDRRPPRRGDGAGDARPGGRRHEDAPAAGRGAVRSGLGPGDSAGRGRDLPVTSVTAQPAQSGTLPKVTPKTTGRSE